MSEWAETLSVDVVAENADVIWYSLRDGVPDPGTQLSEGVSPSDLDD